MTKVSQNIINEITSEVNSLYAQGIVDGIVLLKEELNKIEDEFTLDMLNEIIDGFLSQYSNYKKENYETENIENIETINNDNIIDDSPDNGFNYMQNECQSNGMSNDAYQALMNKISGLQ